MTSPFRQVLRQALGHALEYLEQLEQLPVGATASLSQLRQRLELPLPDTGMEATQVIDELVEATRGGIIGNAGGRFFGWVIGGALPAALAADWLTATWDQNAALYACAPAEAVIEEVCGSWLKQLLGLPLGASFALVSGCQMAHFTCLAAARHALLARRGWDCEQDGLSGAPRMRILSSGARHGSIERAIRLLGLGNRCVLDLPTDEHGRLQATTLNNALAEDTNRPTIVLLQAGDLNIGAFDPFAELIPLAQQAGAWVHIDGAFGLWAATSPAYRHLLAGAEQADSWATDGHKWLNVPYDCGYAFVAHPQAHRASMSHRASYLSHEEEARDQIDWNPEWSRRGRGIATYAALRQLGREGVADLIERCCRHAQALARQIGDLPGAELVWEPQINQGLVRFLDPSPRASAADHDSHTDAIIAAIMESGEAFFSGTTWQGQRCMRISVCNWQTNEADVARAFAATAQALKQAREKRDQAGL
ncbi:aspartate aminotransferase family protein [Ktedonosporobacter rubrisoli]|uniref:Aspartate aminotransferase family protein n=1 Tax=Ktedonosporobacter rubrisoli TaxID=2509675 RepID=A0A4P6JVQ4_KTERU|nr:pyridoxal-dependent decarboxylase [Ktedonosporobacter rubrisoli]QBD79525.1 aspartate aminotransferase family protein [Ktedonosporobacter rubrisoli]